MFGTYDLLDHILPCTDRTKPHDTLRLEYLSACKLMENDITNLIPHIPASMFDLLLKSVIYKCYLEFINIDGVSMKDIGEFYGHFNKKEIEFPNSLWILILNWPHTEFSLMKMIPSLHPPINIYLNSNSQGRTAKQNQSICKVYGHSLADFPNVTTMVDIFNKFRCRLIQFIMQSVFKCTPRNTLKFTSKLRKLDLSGLGIRYMSNGTIPVFLQLNDLLIGMCNSTIDTFGHKIDIFVDAVKEIEKLNKGIKLLKNISKENLNPNLGLSVYFKNIIFVSIPHGNPLPSDIFKVLALQSCEYIQLRGFDIDRSSTENLCTYLPKLVGINLNDPVNMENLQFLCAFECIEQLSFEQIPKIGIIDTISNMSKGLKYLDLCWCLLQSNDLECLGNSKHSNTLLELDLSLNELTNDSEAVGLIMLCHKLKNIKVLTLDGCSLDTLSSQSVIHLLNAFKGCITLESLSMSVNHFSPEITKTIIDILAQKQVLRYLSLALPGLQYNLCKTFHEIINKFRHSPIYISWCLRGEW